jgi:hypothetical protein
MHAETLADKTIVFSEREVFKVVVMSSNIEAVRALFLRWWMRWCEVVEFEVVECEVVEFEVVDVHHLIY